MKKISETPVKKVYESNGYKIKATRLFDEVPLITIENIGINKILYPSFITDGETLTISYNNIQAQSVERNFMPIWIEDVGNFIEDFYENLDEIKTFN